MRLIPQLLLLLILTCNICKPVRAQKNYWQQELNYKIDVALNDTEHTLDGFLHLRYKNHSPDTLRFIWFHVWPNAFKNDRTAFSDQLLENGRIDFYFSDKEQKGYINRLDFRVNDITARTEDHPNHIDVIKLLLPQPLAPGESIKITTPFHVKLPYNFSRGGHEGQSYQITQWYPKPAVYDRKGWHPMPYLDQGEFYSEFGDYEVKITLPKNYVVAATGELQNEEEKEWLKERSRQVAVNSQLSAVNSQQVRNKQKTSSLKAKPDSEKIKTTNNPSPEELKTLIYKQNNVHDFAWFADKRFIVNYDTCSLASGKIIDVFSFYTPSQSLYWKNSIRSLKNAVLAHSLQTGEYPYNIISAVEGKQGFTGGMEYPTITILHGLKAEQAVDETIFHEVGHNWFYGILASNEREFPWMDEGLNSFYDKRYTSAKKSSDTKNNSSKLPADWQKLIIESIASVKKDQPIATASDQMSFYNYGFITYGKTAYWMQHIERHLGKDIFDSCMKTYYQRWQFKHPYPEDLKAVFTEVSGRNMDSLFSLLYTTGNIGAPKKKTTKLTAFYSLKDTDKYDYIAVSPLTGFNLYDGIMLGGIIHNYSLPLKKFQFAMAPLYGTKSKQFNGIGRLSYTWYPNNTFHNIEFSLNGSRFTQDNFTDSAGRKYHFGFRKLTPALRLELKEKNPRSTSYKFIQLKTFITGEDQLSFRRDTVLNIDVIGKQKTNYNIGQLKFVWDNYRALYPYRMEMQFESGKDFGRLAFTGNYFLNFTKKGGMAVRWFAGKFFYYGEKTLTKQFDNDRFHLNMTGPKGYEDYTYSNYFFGRNEFDGIASQQIMLRDGAFKVRTDLLSSKTGKTDNWLTALNFSVDVPDKYNILNAFPLKIPLKIFADIGTYAEAWDKDAEGTRFLFDAGLQFSFFKQTLNIFVPVLYSRVYRDYFKSTPGNSFWQRISFSIDIQNISPRKWVIQSLK